MSTTPQTTCPDCNRPRGTEAAAGDGSMPVAYCWRAVGCYGAHVADVECLRAALALRTTELKQARGGLTNCWIDLDRSEDAKRRVESRTRALEGVLQHAVERLESNIGRQEMADESDSAHCMTDRAAVELLESALEQREMDAVLAPPKGTEP